MLRACAGAFWIGDRLLALCIGGCLLAVCSLGLPASAPAAPAFVQVGGSPFTVPASPESVAFSPSGTLLASADLAYQEEPNFVSVFSAGADGLLAPVLGAPFPSAKGTNAVAFSPSGSLLAVPFWEDGVVRVFQVGSEGALTPAPGGSSATGVKSRSVAFNPSGTLWATANDGPSTISMFSVAPPTATIGAPADGGIYTVGELVPTSFSCADSPYAPGLSSCTDGNAAGSPNGHLDTSTLGTHAYTVTATSGDGQTGAASIAYAVVAPSSPGTTPEEGSERGNPKGGNPKGGIPEQRAPEAGGSKPGTHGSPAARTPALKVAIPDAAALVAGAHARVRLSCSGGTVASACRGRLSLAVRRRILQRTGHRHHLVTGKIVLARGSYELRSGRSRIVGLRLTREGRMLLAFSPKPAVARARATLDGGSAARRTLALRLRHAA
jgi:hypothetical protein